LEAIRLTSCAASEVRSSISEPLHFSNPKSCTIASLL
jgi:hypothetical protein